PYGLYDLNLVTYDSNSIFNQKYSYGFIPLWGLQSEIGFQVKNTINSKKNIKKIQADLIKYKKNNIREK
ncbi:MAG: argininosuccinate synthase, partial [Candidatus Lokiarchaeota archaeon]|nr:argininosuccinate synthase [Candidatus Lokiarchaeota archaeon]